MFLIQRSVRYPIVALVIFALLFIFGLHEFAVMPKTEDPTITIRTGLVLAQYPGATAEQVEKQVTKTLEKHIFKFPEVRKDKTFSTSRHGLAIINVELEDSVKDTDVFWSKLRHEMNETAATELPAGVRGPLVQSDFGDTVAMLIAIHGKRYGYRELQDYADKIQDKLRTIREVGKMVQYGGQAEQFWVTSSMEKISQYAVTPYKIIQALQQRNIITDSGTFHTQSSDVPLRTSGQFTREDDINNLLVDISKTGLPVYLRDIAKVTRRYQDPTFMVRCNGEASVLLSIEMQKGKNIVELGDDIARVLSETRALLPPDLTLDIVANQPAVVKARINTLSREFLLAIGAVLLVTVILLPIRVACVSAVAIPVTLATTIGIMNSYGIQLHQVSIAALIVVLGIVVDDAIVIADNYVELLDKKVPVREAAWRSASEVFVPVFVATITIICSFLPLLILSGSTGEFIRALPITVAIALTVSFLVAILLTPILCHLFVKKGLHQDKDQTAGAKNAEKKKSRRNFLDILQSLYGFAIRIFMRHKIFAGILAFLSLLLAALLFQQIPQQFFPSAERNQFVIDLWMRQGTRIEATDAAMTRIERYLKQRQDIVQYASFIGHSAPRFYYNVNPQEPDSAYGQMIVKTRTEEMTPLLVQELGSKLADLVPEGTVIVKELQQGNSVEAPVEIRISGDKISELKTLAARVESILNKVPYSRFVNNDYYNDAIMADIHIDTEVANRFGLTNAMVARTLSGSFDGVPVSVFWEGDRPVTIMLRLEKDERSTFDDIQSTYISSSVSSIKVPMRAIASLHPEWEEGRIVRRNGVRTLTVRSFVENGHYASQLLKQIQGQVDSLPLPKGYHLSYGGEKYNQDETLPTMVKALGISLLAIFLVLLLQFRNISEPFLVMCSIPLMLPGAIIGLWITGNSFGFTAFVGLISLCGIVVRNAIILVDYINEKRKEGHSIEQAAMEAGQRRLRPIFLTTMAAAVGVTPMILSGSSLWSPLASVIAFGLFLSMFFTLLVVPVLYVLLQRKKESVSVPPLLTLFLCSLLVASPHFAQAAAMHEDGAKNEMQLSLAEALDLAIQKNSDLQIIRAQLEEKTWNEKSVRSDYYPHLSDETVLSGLTENHILTIPAGALGTIAGIGSFPTSSLEISQDEDVTWVNSLTVQQPLTQLFKIHDAASIAQAERQKVENNLKKAEGTVRFGCMKIYLGIYLAQKEMEVNTAQIQASKEAEKEVQDSVTSESKLPVYETSAKVQLLQAQQDLLTTQIRHDDLEADLCELLGLPLNTHFSLSVSDTNKQIEGIEYYKNRAANEQEDILMAQQDVTKAQNALAAAKDDMIPELGVFASYIHQKGLSYVQEDVGVVGLKMSWDIFDWGKKSATKREREAQCAQAVENLKKMQRHVDISIEKAYRKYHKAEQLYVLADTAQQLQEERQRIADDQLTAETITPAQHAKILADTQEARYRKESARVALYLVTAELELDAGLL